MFSCVCVGLNVCDDDGSDGGGVDGSTNGRSFVHNRSWWWKLNKLFGLFLQFFYFAENRKRDTIKFINQIAPKKHRLSLKTILVLDFFFHFVIVHPFSLREFQESISNSIIKK